MSQISKVASLTENPVYEWSWLPRRECCQKYPGVCITGMRRDLDIERGIDHLTRNEVLKWHSSCIFNDNSQLQAKMVLCEPLGVKKQVSKGTVKGFNFPSAYYHTYLSGVPLPLYKVSPNKRSNRVISWFFPVL